jgi:16S rRNA G1207 methylase RsmC
MNQNKIENNHYWTADATNEKTFVKTINIPVLINGELTSTSNDFTLSNKVFSKDRLDNGTEILLKSFYKYRLKTGNKKYKNVLDLGCGWGPILYSVHTSFAGETDHLQGDNSDDLQGDFYGNFYGVDVNAQAINLAKINAPFAKIFNEDELADMLLDYSENDPTANANHKYTMTFDLIISNPPIRIGKTAVIQLLQNYLKYLSDDGEAIFVINKNLGGNSIVAKLSDGYSVEKIGRSNGFHVFRFTR